MCVNVSKFVSLDSACIKPWTASGCYSFDASSTWWRLQ